MELLFHVSTAESAPILAGLAGACRRAGRAYGCFFTDKGVLTLADAGAREAAAGASRAVACAESWHRYRGDAPCAVERGSQTDNSAFVGRAARVVSL